MTIGRAAVTQADAATELARLLGVGVVGLLLDAVDDRRVRELLASAQERLRQIAGDSDEGEAVH